MSGRVFLEITQRDPTIARDGRPFDSGNRMKSVEWIYPSVVTGSLRTMTGKALGYFDPEELRAIEVSGALPVRDGELYVVPPADCVLRDESEELPAKAFAVKPEERFAGCSNLPDGIWPALPPEAAGEDFKPAIPPPFVSMELMERWLIAGDWAYPFDAKDVLEKIEKDERTHAMIDPEGGGAKESMLFRTAALVLPRDVTLQVRTAGAPNITGVHPLGGERRLAMWSDVEQAKGWVCPQGVKDALARTQRVRLVLATPAIFDQGWRPRWLVEESAVPGTNVRLKLRGACVERGRAISGWSMEAGSFGPKATRLMAPAGSVYFCEVLSGAAEELEAAWMEPISDQPQDRLDGFGLAIWGVWQ